MKTIKTRTSKRDTYTYTFDDGKKTSLAPGNVDPDTGYVLTEEDIKSLHRLDDREVENNLKNAKTPIQPWEKKANEEWKKEHPYDHLPSRSHVSIDAVMEDGDDTDKGYLGAASLAVMEQEDPMLERLHEVVAMLRPEQQVLYQRVVVNEENMCDVAKEMGLESSIIRHRMKAIREFIKKNF